jgi:Rrf2 family protein
VQITRQADYAVRAILYLARLKPGKRAPTAQIAREQRIPTTFLAKIVSQLSVAGIVHATRGARGGVALARPPEDISLLEIVEAIDGPVALNECTLTPEICPLSDDCPIRPVWCDARAELVGRLSQTKLGSLIKTQVAPVALALAA